jgi:hypothetical protein
MPVVVRKKGADWLHGCRRQKLELAQFKLTGECTWLFSNSWRLCRLQKAISWRLENGWRGSGDCTEAITFGGLVTQLETVLIAFGNQLERAAVETGDLQRPAMESGDSRP